MAQLPLPEILPHSDDGKLNPPSFATFCEKFVEQIASPDLGEPPRNAEPGSMRRKGSAAKELLTAGISDRLRSTHFLKKIYQVVAEHYRLESERERVPRVAKSLRPWIQGNRNAQKRLENIARQLRLQFLSRYKALLGVELEQEIQVVVNKIEDIRYTLRQREKSQVSRIHPATRREGDEPSGWQSLLPDADYDLSKITSKAVDQWSYERLDQELMALTRIKKTRKLSQMTRMKLISAICYASGIGPVEPTAVKQHLQSKKRTPAKKLKEN